MRGFLLFVGLVVLIAIGLVVVGVIRFNASDEELNISVDRNKIEQTIDDAAEDTGRALERAGQRMREGVPDRDDRTEP